MQIVKKEHYVVKSVFLLSNAVNNPLWSLHKGSYGNPMLKDLFKDLKNVCNIRFHTSKTLYEPRV